MKTWQKVALAYLAVGVVYTVWKKTGNAITVVTWPYAMFARV
jgi:multidrug transporter EmrE-like cation transporter